MDLIRSNTSRYILCNLVICRFRYDNICKNVNIKCPIGSRSDPNIATCFLDFGHLCTCRYLCIRRDAFITNRYAQLRWGKIMTATPMLILELLEVGRWRGDHDLSHIGIGSRQYIKYIFDRDDTSQLKAV